MKDIDNLKQERLLFNCYANEKELAAYHKRIAMTKEILESSLSKIIANHFYDLFHVYLVRYEQLIDEIVDEIEEHVEDTKVPQEAMEGLDKWFIQYKENNYR